MLQARPHLLHALETGEFDGLIDPRLGKQYVESEMFRMIEAAAACVRHSAPKRPRMVQVNLIPFKTPLHFNKLILKLQFSSNSTLLNRW